MSERAKQLWYVAGPDTTADVMQAVYHRSFDRLVLGLSHGELLERAPLPRGLDLAVRVADSEAIAAALDQVAWREQVRVLVAEDASLLEAIAAATAERDVEVGLLHAVNDEASLHASLELAERVDWLILDFLDPTNIPLEQVLATTQNTRCRVVKRVTSAQDGISSAMTMECGADAIALDSQELAEITALEAAFTQSRVSHLSLVSAEVTAIKQAGMGDRICIDTTSQLTSDEGMLLGSTSAGGLLLCSETHFLPYMELRPFRVNAGSLHHYVWAPDNRTYYLSELRAGVRWQGSLTFDFNKRKQRFAHPTAQRGGP